MDRITKSHFEEFKNLYAYNTLPECDAFELFCIYCIVSKYVKHDTITNDMLENINIGKGGDWGIDGIIVIVNGQVVFTQEAVDDLRKANGSLSVQLVFIQAKTSPQFKVQELGLSLDGVKYILKDVLDEQSLPSSNESLTDYRDLIKHIYSYCASFRNGENPSLDLFYMTCGTYNAQDDFKAKIEDAKIYVKSKELVRSFCCNMLGCKEIVEFYKNTKNKIEATLNVENKISLPLAENVEDGYLCLLPFEELRKLFVDENDNIINDVFYDNIRAYQGENQINRKMKESIRSGNIDLFAAMNNGITVITRSFKVTGQKMLLSDYQIVNGCQTCNVLNSCNNVAGIERLRVSVKIIYSSNKDVRDKIIIANNSQTEVKQEQLVSLLETQKQIEDYYNAQNDFDKLYYERRSKQYKFGDVRVPPYKIITIPNQIQSFVSMMMGEPDKVRGYYGSIVEELDKNGRKVFAADTKPDLYYTSALASYKMAQAFNNGTIPTDYKKIKFHVLLAFRLMCEPSSIPAFNSNKVTEYCNHLCNILCDRLKCKKGFEYALVLIDKTLGRKPNDRDRFQTGFTKNLKKLAFEAERLKNSRKEEI